MDLAVKVVAAFTSVADDIDSKNHQFESNQVLVKVASGLRAAGFTVEEGWRFEGLRRCQWAKIFPRRSEAKEYRDKF